VYATADSCPGTNYVPDDAVFHQRSAVQQRYPVGGYIDCFTCAINALDNAITDRDGLVRISHACVGLDSGPGAVVNMNVVHHDAVEQAFGSDTAVETYKLAIADDDVGRVGDTNFHGRSRGHSIATNDGKAVQINRDIVNLRPDI